MARKKKKEPPVAFVEIKQEPHIEEGQFLRIYLEHKEDWFDFTLDGEDEHVVGYVVDRRIDPGAPARKNFLCIGPVYPYPRTGSPRLDPEIREIRFSDITGVRCLPKEAVAA